MEGEKKKKFGIQEFRSLTSQDKEVGEIDIPRDDKCLIQRQRSEARDLSQRDHSL